MSRTDGTGRLFRIAGEFVLIVVGVMVALAGDSWLNDREEGVRTNAALAQILGDLERDSVRLARLASFPPQHDSIRAAIWTTPPDAGLSTDSATALLRGLIRGTDYRPIRSAYESLLQTDGLRHVADPALRSRIVEYYEEYQAELVVWYDWWVEFNIDFYSLVKDDLEPIPTSYESVASTGFRGLEFRATKPWSELRSDDELMGQLWLVNIYSTAYQARALAAAERNAELRVLLSSYAGR